MSMDTETREDWESDPNQFICDCSRMGHKDDSVRCCVCEKRMCATCFGESDADREVCESCREEMLAPARSPKR